MNITVNGQTKQIAGKTSVAALLEELSLQPQRVAVELNRHILPRLKYASTYLAEADSLEIVTLVGGG